MNLKDAQKIAVETCYKLQPYCERIKIAGGVRRLKPWRKIGWCGSDKGLRKITDCVEMKGADGKSKWKCINKDAELPPVWDSEKMFFDWIRVPFIHPSKRIV